MNNTTQRGFGTITLWAALGAALVIAGLGIALKVQTARLDAVRSEYAGFVAQVKANGDAQIAKNKAKEAENKAIKERLDNENKDLRAKLAANAERLRNAINSRSGGLSTLPVATVRPDLACFDRAELDTAIRLYQSDLLGIAEKGATATLELNTGKVWVKEQMAR